MLPVDEVDGLRAALVPIRETLDRHAPQQQVGGLIVGGTVSAFENRTTGKNVALQVHPYAVQGTALALSDQVNIPGSKVPAPFVVRSVQDLQYIDWPQIQMSWDASTYLYEALIPYAPGWCGAVTGIAQVNN